MTEAQLLDRIFDLLQSQRFTFAHEEELQQGIALALTAAKIAFERETPLLPRDRPDFLIKDLVVEVKVAGSLASVTRQLYRYSESKRVGSLLLVTNRIALHSRLPNEMNHKPLKVLRLINSAL